jgi:hypothetical protein
MAACNAVIPGPAYDPARARLTLTRRQIAASLSAHARPCACASWLVF